MFNAELLRKARSSESLGPVARRLGMLIVLINEGDIFVLAASRYSCDRRTVSLWYGRMLKCTDIAGIRRALTDKPRQGRPTKIPKKLLADAEKWCGSRAFTPMELQTYLKKISGVELGLSRTRYCAREWKKCKKTSPVHVNRAPLGEAYTWKRSIMPKASWYTRQKYTIVTMDESNFKDGMLSRRFWTAVKIASSCCGVADTGDSQCCVQ